MSENNKYRIVNCYKENFQKCRFVGKCYKNSDRVDGMYGYQWVKWNENGWFKPLETQLTEDFRKAYPDADAYIGLMKNKYGADENYFEYWIGMFLPENSIVPDGYDYIDLNFNHIGICWIKGGENDVYCHEGECYTKLVDSGMKVPSTDDGGCYFFERYICDRIDSPDENGEVILDIGYFVEA